MLELSRDILDRAEELAGAEDSRIEEILGVLRGLALEEFGELMLSMPNPEYPNLASRLPRMADEATQKMWTGTSGLALHKQTAAFVRQLELAYTANRHEGMAGKTILDFGVGYGRIMRLLYYYSDPGRIWGVDAWAESLQTCRDAGMLGNLSQSDSVPTSLPVGDAHFDVGVAFSVFTHLKPSVAESALDAVRASMADGGIFVATVRPIEFWEFLDTTQGREISVEMCHDHRTQGHAYFPHPGARGDTYGETSLALDFFDRPGWKVVSHDWSRVDYFQVSVVLQAV